MAIEDQASAAGLDSATADDARQFRRGALAITGGFWVYNLVVSTVRAWLDHRDILVQLLGMRVLIAAAGCGCCYAIHLVLRAARHRPFHQQALLMAAITPFVADGFAWIAYFGVVTILPTAPPTGSVSETIYAVVYWVWFYMAWAALYMALRYSFQVRDRERRLRASQALAHAAQLRSLRNQIHPHFLFNTLNSISALILDHRNEVAEGMVARLADFFRISLTVDPLDDIRLADEIELQRHYLGIEQLRFPDLAVEICVPEDLLGALVPTLILQPLVENAVKYAVAHSQAPATIRIEARTAGTRLHLEVTDDGNGTPEPAGPGIGLHNVRERLANRFFGDFAFTAGPRQPRGFAVVLEMPLRRA